jgi:hypothetical protein
MHATDRFACSRAGAVLSALGGHALRRVVLRVVPHLSAQARNFTGARRFELEFLPGRQEPS